MSMRRISLTFGIIFTVEFVTLFGMLLWFMEKINDSAKLAEISSGALFSFGSLLLTSAIVYHHFWLHPELRVLNVTVEPITDNGNSLAKSEYRHPVFERTNYGLTRYPDVVNPKEENGFKIVETDIAYSGIRVSTDVCNIGGSETTIHEYVVREVKPDRKRIETYICRRSLPNEKRETIDFFYPTLSTLRKESIQSGEYEFEIVVKATTHEKKRRVKIIISKDLKIVKWKELDC
jgi:hypothetical protein